MRTSLFLVSHLGSDSQLLYHTLNNNPRIQGCKTERNYNHITSLESLLGIPHKLRTSAAIYMDHLLFNYNFSFVKLYEISKFIYCIREAKPTLTLLFKHYKPEYAFRYYCYRLRRICEMARQTPFALVVTPDYILKNSFKEIEEYLGLPHPLERQGEPQPVEDIESKFFERGQDCYERHFYYLKNLGIKILAH